MTFGGGGLGLERSGNIYAGSAQNFLFFRFCNTKFFLFAKKHPVIYFVAMTFQSLPYEPRKIEATEQRLGQIYDAARRGLKGDALALACDMMPIEYRRLIQLDPVAEYYETKGRADGEMEMAGVLRDAALAGDAKAALDILKHVHGWVAKQAVSVEVNQTISITAALQEAQQRVIEGQIIDASLDNKLESMHTLPNDDIVRTPKKHTEF